MNIGVNFDVQVEGLDEKSVKEPSTTNKGNENKIDEKVIYEKLWQCRNFEIEHYWHRMVFMTAFMLLSFTAYGGFFVACVSKECRLSFFLCNLIGIAIALIGIALSSLWVMMGKGSKAWYEEYERIIGFFVEEIKCDKYAGLDYKRIKTNTLVPIDNRFWNTKAGAYSVSKIGIALGHLATVVWCSIVGVHIVFICNEFIKKHFLQLTVTVSEILSIGVFIGVLLIMLRVVYGWSNRNLKSSYFASDLKEKED